MEERNENVMTYEENNIIDPEEVEVIYAEPEHVENGLDLKTLGLGAAAIIGGIYVVKKWVAPKVSAWNENRLAKKGYVKLQPGEMIVRGEVEEEVLEEAVETTEEK